MAKKKGTKNKVVSKKYSKYKVVEGKLQRSKSCPKCGPGFFLGQHKDRLYCGSCHYTQFSTKK